MQKNIKGILKPPILVGDLKENALVVWFEILKLVFWMKFMKKSLQHPMIYIIFLEATPLIQIAYKGVEWVKKGLKWSCKIGDYKETYAKKWIRTTHLKKVHELVVEKGNLECP
jgi:hypothetical protein